MQTPSLPRLPQQDRTLDELGSARHQADRLTKHPKKKLRVGLLIDSFEQPRWVHYIVESIKNSTYAELILVVKNRAGAGEKPVKNSRMGSYWKNRDHLLYALYQKYDERKHKEAGDAFEPLSIEELVSGCEVVEVEPVMKKHSDWFPQEDIERILKHDLDVALRFGFRIIKGDALKIAKHGIWSFHHGDNTVNRGGPAGFWEVLEGEPVTGSILQVLTEELDSGKVLCRSWAPTSDKFSVKANRNNYYWKSAPLMLVKLKELHENDEVRVLDDIGFAPYSNRFYKMPTNRELLPLMLKLMGRYAGSKLKALRHFNQWALAYRFKSNPDDPNTTFYKYKYLIPPKDRFWADPFPVKDDGKYYIFFEEYLYDTARGSIAVLEIDRSGVTSDPVTVLDRPYHLSYPFIFHWEGNYYMIPDSSGNKTVELYRCTSFPHKWELEKVLIEGISSKDATLIELDGVWWMFLNVASQGVTCPWDELHLYYSDRPDGEWTPHPHNPVKLDVRSSRPAGRLFYWNGELLRPAQDGSKHYGYAITFNKVLTLNKREFREEPVSKVYPHWDERVIGTHTFNTADDLTVIDCLMTRKK